MTVHEVIEAFARGATLGAASKCKYYPQGRLRIEGDKLYNYDTVIAYWFNGIMLINGTKYSKTTSVHQNRLKRQNVKKLIVDEDTLNEVMRHGDLYVDTIKKIIEKGGC
jgi:DNA transposition AAA+ family ATPase